MTGLYKKVRNSLEVPSFVVGIVHGEALINADGFGNRTRSTQQSAAANTLFNIGSVSKPATATLLAILVEQGKLKLVNRVADFLPETVQMPTYQGRPTKLTAWHLTTQTSGLPMDLPNRRNIIHGLWLNPGQAKPYSIASLYEALGRTKLCFEPGTQYRYTNFGYGLLGHVLERAAGEPLEALLRTQLLGPLQMTNSTLTLDQTHRDQFATHYLAGDRNRPRRVRPRTEFGEVFAHGGMISSVEELARFVSLHFRGQTDILSLAALEEMHTS